MDLGGVSGMSKFSISQLKLNYTEKAKAVNGFLRLFVWRVNRAAKVECSAAAGISGSSINFLFRVKCGYFSSGKPLLSGEI